MSFTNQYWRSYAMYWKYESLPWKEIHIPIRATKSKVYNKHERGTFNTHPILYIQLAL